jgi:phage recombination protein Bet
MNAENAQPADRPSLIRKFASKYSIDPKVLMSTLKATCFRVPEGEVSDEQMVALLVVADQYSLNPFTKEIYAFPDKHKGIVPVVSVDGWVRIINEHPDYNGYEVILPDAPVAPIEGERPAAWAWVTIKLHRKNVQFTPALTEYLDECYRPPTKRQGNNGPYTINGPWQTHPKRFLRHKALIQAARVVFGFAGIYDEDEAERILNGSVVSTQGARVEAVKATDIAKDALRRQLEQTRGASLNLPVQETISREKIAAEVLNKAFDNKPEPVREVEKRGSYRFDMGSALAHIRAAKDLAALKKAWNEVSDDYEFSDREMPIDVEAIYRDLVEEFQQREET